MPNAVNQFINNVAGGFFGNDFLRDFKHASKTFRSGLYQNAPKFKFLFHVYFDINTDVLNSTNPAENNFGILVKSVKLPSYGFTTHDMNQYNRKRIVQTKIKYDPVEIVFHDDNDNFINGLWYRYYTYYYADATKPKVVFAGARGGRPADQQQGGGTSGPANSYTYDSRTQYQPSIAGDDNWGYIGETSVPSGPNPVKKPFFRNITVFGMNRHNFTAYTLINPIITRFSHDTYNYDEGGGVMANTMTLEYETVVYNQGAIDGQTPDNIVTGFGNQSNYDRKLSPISVPGSNSNILSKNGLIESAGGAINNFTNNPLGSIRTAGAVYNGLKNINLKQTLKAEVTQGIQNALQNSDNRARYKLFDIPTYSATPSGKGTAGAPPAGTRNQPPPVTDRPVAGGQSYINGLD